LTLGGSTTGLVDKVRGEIGVIAILLIFLFNDKL